jgi:glycosyltransferase involved in cell wall biosynthesis
MPISVVIPTKNRIDALQATVDTLEKQDLDGHRAEIIVVDNGSTDGTTQWLNEAHDRLPITLKTVAEPRPGVSAARNTGVRHAQFDLILFLNDDTSPASTDLLAGHIAAHAYADGKEIAVLGRITYPPEDMTDPFMRWLNDDAQFDFARLDGGESPRAPHFFTAHISFPRAAYARADGMDERLQFGFEDAALGHRMELQGVPIRYHPELVVHHNHHINVSEWPRRGRSMGRAGWHINHLYPINPPLAQPATTPYWGILSAASRVLSRFSSCWSWLPHPPREWIYSVVHLGSYARGYREARRHASDNLTPERPAHQQP